MCVRKIAKPTLPRPDGGGTVHWGLVYLKGESPSKKKVEVALREAGFDFAHNVLTQMADVKTDHSES